MIKTHSMREETTKSPAGQDRLLRVEDLWVSFPLPRGKRLHALRGIDLEVQRGQAVGLVGESGCGKSTLAMAVMVLIQAERGRIVLEGQDLRALSSRHLRTLRRRFQMVFQDPRSSFNPRMTVGQSVAEPLEIFGIGESRKERAQRVEKLLDLVGLDPNLSRRYPHELSGGQRQRAAVARALATDPVLLIADEPTSALDVSIQAQVVNLLARLQKERNLGLLFISHDLQLVRALCDRTAVMYLGKIVEQGPTEMIFARPLHPYTKALLASVPTLQPKSKRPDLLGDVPSPMDLPAGCPFQPRCPLGRNHPDCSKSEPELQEIAKDHAVACHLVGEQGHGEAL